METQTGFGTIMVWIIIFFFGGNIPKLADKKNIFHCFLLNGL